MTIADLDKAMKTIVDAYSVYGIECTFNAIARAYIQHPYLKDPDYLHMILSGSIIRVLKEQEEQNGKL